MIQVIRRRACIGLLLCALTAQAQAELASAPDLTRIDSLLKAKKLSQAVDAAIAAFKLDRSECRAIVIRPIDAKDGNGNQISARTLLDQTVVLDPSQFAFKSARYLVSVLAHELAHCRQHQKAYELAISSDSRLRPLSSLLPSLKVLGELSEHASRALGQIPGGRKAAAHMFAARAKDLGLKISPSELDAYANRVVEDMSALDRTMGDLMEMEASLSAFDLKDALPAPSAPGADASPEFAFQYRYLMTSTTGFLRQRKLLGSRRESFCKLENFVPGALTAQYEQACVRSVALLERHLESVRE